MSTLATAIQAAGLADVMNATEAITVYAPFSGAFEAVRTELGDEAVNALLVDRAGLGALLEYHVHGKCYNAEQLVAAGTTEQLAGGRVTVGGTADAPTFAGPGNATPASTLCGDIP